MESDLKGDAEADQRLQQTGRRSRSSEIDRVLDAILPYQDTSNPFPVVAKA